MAGDVDGKDGVVAVALHSFSGGDTETALGLVPLARGCHCAWRPPRLAVALPPASLAGSDSGWHILLPCFPAQVLVQKYLI